MTTPRDALAAALTNSHPCPDPDMHAEDAVIVLSALAAEGWVLVADPWPMDVERLLDWWDSLSELDQFNAYRIEKSNADALAAPDPAPLAEAVAAERARIYGQLVDRLWGCDADANAVLDIVEDDAAIEGSKE